MCWFVSGLQSIASTALTALSPHPALVRALSTKPPTAGKTGSKKSAKQVIGIDSDNIQKWICDKYPLEAALARAAPPPRLSKSFSTEYISRDDAFKALVYYFAKTFNERVNRVAPRRPIGLVSAAPGCGISAFLDAVADPARRNKLIDAATTESVSCQLTIKRPTGRFEGDEATNITAQFIAQLQSLESVLISFGGRTPLSVDWPLLMAAHSNHEDLARDSAVALRLAHRYEPMAVCAARNRFGLRLTRGCGCSDAVGCSMFGDQMVLPRDRLVVVCEMGG